MMRGREPGFGSFVMGGWLRLVLVKGDLFPRAIRKHGLATKGYLRQGVEEQKLVMASRCRWPLTQRVRAIGKIWKPRRKTRFQNNRPKKVAYICLVATAPKAFRVTSII
jgi:hypothetical protein